VVSQVITLYLTPVVYTYMARWVTTRRIPSTATANAATPEGHDRAHGHR
jgi:hypothetical protein